MPAANTRIERLGRELVVRGSAEGVDSYFVVSDDGVEELLHVRGGAARSFSWEYVLPDGWQIGATADSVQVFDEAGWIVLVFDAAWAQDAAGAIVVPRVTLDRDAARIVVDVPQEQLAGEFVLDPHWAVATSFDDHAYQWKTCGSSGDSLCRATQFDPDQWDQGADDPAAYAVGYTVDEAFRIWALGSKVFADSSWAHWRYTPPAGVKVDQIAWNGRQNNVAGAPGASPFRCGLQGWVGVVDPAAPTSQELVASGGTFDLSGPMILRRGAIGSALWFDSVALAMVHDGAGDFTSAADPLNACHVRRLGSNVDQQQLHVVLVDEVDPVVNAAPALVPGAGPVNDVVVGPDDMPRFRLDVTEQGSGVDVAQWIVTGGAGGNGTTDMCLEESTGATQDAARPCSLSTVGDPDVVPGLGAIAGGDGSRSVGVTVQDFASRVSNQASANVTWDATDPSAPTGLSIDGSHVNGSTRFIGRRDAVDVSWADGADANLWRHQALITADACPTDVSSVGWVDGNAGAAMLPIVEPVEGVTYRLCVRAVDAANNRASASIEFEFDLTAPVISGVYDGPVASTDLDWISAVSRLSASWDAPTDDQGIAAVSLCFATATSMGNECSGTIVAPWFAIPVGTQGGAGGVAVDVGESYVACVSASDNLGNVGYACSDGQKVALASIPRDGIGVFDIEYQVDTTELSINWDPIVDFAGSTYDWKLCSEPSCAVAIDEGTTSSTSVTVDGLTLTSGRYIGCVKSTDPFAYSGEFVCSNGVRVDADAPVMGAPRDGAGDDIDTITYRSGSSVGALTANWDPANDGMGMGIASYDWRFCTDLSCSALLASGSTTALTVTAEIVPGLTVGAPVACVRAVDNAGHNSSFECSDGATLGTGGTSYGSGTYTMSTTWTKANGPHIVNGSVTVASGATLTIEAGAVVKFASTGARLMTDSVTGGNLVAIGTAAAPILFTSAADSGTALSMGGGSAGAWSGIDLRSGTNVLEHVTIRNAGYLVSRTIDVSGSNTSLTVKRARITNNNSNGIRAGSGADIVLEDTVLAGNGVVLATGSGSTVATRRMSSVGGVSAQSDGIVSVERSTITGASMGVFIGTGTGSTVKNSTLSGNTIGVNVSGAGVHAEIRNSVVRSNSAEGVNVANGTSASVVGSRIDGNRTGIYSAGSVVVRGSHITASVGSGIGAPGDGIYALVETGEKLHVINSTISNNGAEGIDAIQYGASSFLYAGLRIRGNVRDGIEHSGAHASVTGDPARFIGNRITENGTGVSGAWGIEIDGGFGVSGDGSKWPIGRGNTVTGNGNTSYGGQLSTPYYPSPAGSSISGQAYLPHWDGNEWGDDWTENPEWEHGAGYGECVNGTYIGSMTMNSGHTGWIKHFPTSVTSHGYFIFNPQNGNDGTMCQQSSARIPETGPLAGALLGLLGNIDVVKHYRLGHDPVNTATGNFVEQRTDVSNPAGLGVPLEVARVYNSADHAVGALGRGWSWNLGARLDVSDSQLSIEAHLEDGTRATFLALGDGSFEGRFGTRSRLEAVGDPVTAYELRRTDGSVLTFDPDGRLLSNRDRNGFGVTLTYSGAFAYPQSALDEAGIEYAFTYDSNDRLSQVASSDGRSVGYEVVDDVLVSVTDVRGNDWVYAYDEADRVASLTTPEGVRQYLNAYAADGRVIEQKDAGGNVTTFAWNPVTRTATLTDAAGGAWVDVYDADEQLLTSMDPTGRTVSYTYDDRGYRDSSTDGRGNVTRFTHDDRGNVLQRVLPAPLGSVEQFTYDVRDNVTQHVNGRGFVTNFEYDGSGNLVRVKRQDGSAPGDVDGNVTEYVRDATTKQVEEVIDARGNSTFHQYDAVTHRLVSTAKQLGEPTTFSYDAVGRVVSVVDPVGNAAGSTPTDYDTVFAFDAAGNVTSVTDAEGDQTQRGYNRDGQLDHVIDGEGERWDYRYDAHGQLDEVVDPAIGSAARASTSFAYDVRGLLIREADQLGRVTTYTYNKAGLRTSKVAPKGNAGSADPDRFRTRYLYDRDRNLTDVIDPLGYATSFQYDAIGRVIVESDQRHRDTRFTYDATGNVIQVRSPLGDVSTRSYDALGRLVGQSDFRGNVTEFERNEVGSVVKQRTPIQAAASTATTFCYDDNERLFARIGARAGDITCGTSNDHQTGYSFDEAGRVIAVTDPEGNVTQTTYDRAGRIAALIDAEGNSTAYSYDANSRLDAVEAPAHPTLGARITSYGYNEVGDLVRRTDPNGDATEFVYDAAHQLVSRTRPNDAMWAFGYDLNGNQITQVDANGAATVVAGDGTTTYDYDRANRLVGISYSDATPDVEFALSPTGRVTGATAGAISEMYAYDGLDRVLSVTRGTDEFEFAYDADGNVTSRTYPGTSAIPFAYDSDGRLTHVGAGAAQTAYGYDHAGNRLQTTLPNGTLETRSYDDADRLVGIQSVHGASTVEDIDYVLDGVGNPLAMSTLSRDESYAYDEMNQLAAACFDAPCAVSTDDQVAYSYDKVGNRVAQERGDGVASTLTRSCYSSDGSGELLGTTMLGNCIGFTPTRTYDHNGNLTSDGASTFTWDLANRLVTADTGINTWSYAYDALGKRASSTDGSTTRTYLWDVTHDEPQLAVERQGSIDRRTYTYGNGRISQTDGTDVQYFLADRVGTVLHLTDDAGGIDSTLIREPFGALRSANQLDPTANDTDLGFTGEQHDPTGLVHLRARQYDPSTGRFTAPDPMEHPIGLPYSNTYHYGFNNPLVNTDPSGMCVFGLSCPFGGEPETVTYHDPNPPEPSCDGKPRSDAATVYCANQLQHKLDCLDPVLRPDQQYAEVCGTGVPVEATGDIDAAFAVVGGVRLVWKGGKWVVAKAAGGGGAAVGATATGSRLVDEAFDAVNDFLGSGTKAIPTKNGDLVLLSKDGTRRVRFDINHPKPHKNPHMHVEVRNPDGTWNKSGQIYPRDVPHE